MLTPVRGLRGRRRRRPGDRRRDHRWRLGGARPPRLALPRRRDRRGRDPARRAERQRALVEHRRDPLRRLPPRAGVGARGVARCRRRGPARRRRSASCAAVRCSSCSTSSTRTAAEESYFSAIEGKTASLMATACRIGGMVSDVSADTPRRAHAVRPSPRHVLPDRRRRARRHRQPTPSSASRPATTCTKASTRCRSSTRSRRRRSCATLLGRKLEWAEVEKVVALVADARSHRRVDGRRAHARDEGERSARPVHRSSTPDVCDRLRTLVDGLVLRSS